MSEATIAFMAEVSEKVIGVGRQLLPEGFRMAVVPAGATDVETARIVAQAQYFLGFIVKPMGPAFYEAVERTRLVQLLSAGYDQVDLGRLRRSRIPLATNGGANAVAVAEHTIMLILAVLRRLRELDSRTRAGKWRPSGPDGEIYELDGKTVGLIGLGMIGRHVATRLRLFGACWSDQVGEEEIASELLLVPANEGRHVLADFERIVRKRRERRRRAMRQIFLLERGALFATCRGEEYLR